MSLQFRLSLERIEEGRVRATLTDLDCREPSGEEQFLWQLEVAQDWTRDAQKSVIKSVAAYLHDFVDLSEGGKY